VILPLLADANESLQARARARAAKFEATLQESDSSDGERSDLGALPDLTSTSSSVTTKVRLVASGEARRSGLVDGKEISWKKARRRALFVPSSLRSIVPSLLRSFAPSLLRPFVLFSSTSA